MKKKLYEELGENYKEYRPYLERFYLDDRPKRWIFEEE